MIAIIVPTRGLTFTKTDEAIDKIVERFDCRVFRTYDKEIPESHNWLVEKALETEADYLLFVEEDNVPTLERVVEMVNRNADISFVDYGVAGWSCSAKDEKTGEVLWCGFGCTLIKRRVFEKMEKPWFRTDKVLRLNDWKWLDQPAKYGGHDIWFFSKAREAGFKITQIAGEIDHLKLDALGRPEINKGLHQIGQKPKITKYQLINTLGGV